MEFPMERCAVEKACALKMLGMTSDLWPGFQCFAQWVVKPWLHRTSSRKTALLGGGGSLLILFHPNSWPFLLPILDPVSFFVPLEHPKSQQQATFVGLSDCHLFLSTVDFYSGYLGSQKEVSFSHPGAMSLL